MLEFTELAPRGLERTGYIPTFLSEEDPRPARDQFNENYAHGGGWMPFKGCKLHTGGTMALTYPGDPPLYPVASAVLHPNSAHPERIFVYPYAWVLILQDDETWEVSRMD